MFENQQPPPLSFRLPIMFKILVNLHQPLHYMAITQKFGYGKFDERFSFSSIISIKLHWNIHIFPKSFFIFLFCNYKYNILIHYMLKRIKKYVFLMKKSLTFGLGSLRVAPFGILTWEVRTISLKALLGMGIHLYRDKGNLTSCTEAREHSLPV